MENWQQAGFGIYVHWPFCTSKCPYCDFNSHVSSSVDQDRWLRAYLVEIDRAALETPGRILSTVFFGGGTPSLMNPDLVAGIIDQIRTRWPMTNNPEITLEANPGSIEAGRFLAYRSAGVTRISMGIQAMNDADLLRLGRKHSVSEAVAAFEIARSCFDRVSFDLIYARQDQSLQQWHSELSSAVDLGLDHLSLYQLTVEDGTAFGDRLAKGGLRGLPSEDLAADMYSVTQEICDRANLPAYEVSNHARMGSESRHNLIYWRGGDYLGIGPGAHGRLTFGEERLATEAPKSPEAWLRLTEGGQPGELPREALLPKDRALEYLMMSLRLVEGLDPVRYLQISGVQLPGERLDQLAQLGMITTKDGTIRATTKGRLVLNAVIRELAVE